MEFNASKLSKGGTKPAPINSKKYINYVLKRKYWIIVIGVLFSAVIGIIAPIYLEMKKEYTTTAVIRFDDPRSSRSIGAITDFSAGMETTGKVSILSTNSFLERVVDSLNLNLIIKTPKVKRTRIFKKVKLTTPLIYGIYEFKRDKKEEYTYKLNFENQKTKHVTTLDSFQINTDSLCHINLNGMTISIRNPELAIFDEVEFILTSNRMAGEALHKKMSYKIDRSRILLNINYTNKDPDFSAFVTNSLSKLFIDRLLEYKRYQTRSILGTLEEQMTVAQKELSQSEETLRNFRSRNPRVFLTDARQTMIQNMAQNETKMNTYKNQLNDIKQLQSNLASSHSNDSKHYAYQDVIAFMESQQIPGATLFSSRYQELLTELRRLQTEGYSNTHPSVSAVQDQSNQLQKEIDGRFRQYQLQVSSNIERSNQNLDSERQNLRKLPGSELRLAELIRNRSIKENVLTSIMVRYNEAKVTDAAVIPDAYIIDYAQPPIIRRKSLTWNLVFFAAGGVLGIIMAISAFLGLAFLDKRLWTSKEVEDKLGLNALAIIPKIGDDKVDYFKNNETIDPKLVTSDYAPTASGEAFRRLRTLLNLRSESNIKTIIISSHFPNEGKSLVCANLAIAYAQQKMKTLLIDCDLRRGVQHSSFAREKVPGLADLLVKRTDVNQQSISQFIQNTHVPNLFLLTSGQQIPNPSEILSSKQMERVYKILASKFDRIVIDTPPFGISPEVFVLNAYVHNIAFILMSKKTNLSRFTDALKEFGQLKNDISGVIINGAEEDPNRKYYDYSYYNY